MSMLSQGTELYYIDPEADSSGAAVREVGCITALNPGGAPATQINDTCLSDTTSRNRPGLREAGQGSMTINADSQDPDHIRLHELYAEDPQPTLKFVAGWSDGTGIPPTLGSDGDFDLPATRTWYRFDAYLVDFPFDFQANATVVTQVPLQRTGPGIWIPKTESVAA